MNGRGKPHVFGKLGFITEPLRVEDFRGELCGDGLTNAWVCSEKFDGSADWFFTEGIFDFLLGGFELFSDEAKFFDEHIETVTKMFRQADAFKLFDGRTGPVRKSVWLVDSVLQKKAFYLEFDASLLFDELLTQASYLASCLLMFGWDGDVSQKSFGSVLSKLAGVEGIGFGIWCGLSRRFGRGNYADRNIGLLKHPGEGVTRRACFVNAP